MTLYAQATELLARIREVGAEEAEEVDGARADAIIQQINQTKSTLSELASFLRNVDFDPIPTADLEPLESAIEDWREAAANDPSGNAGVIHQPVTNRLREVLENSTRKADREAKRCWAELFQDFPTEEELTALGEGPRARNAQLLGRKALLSIKTKHPLNDTSEINRVLGCRSPSRWREKITALHGEVLRARAEAEREWEELQGPLQEFVAATQRPEGFPLPEVTSELLDHLEDAGLLESFVVKPVTRHDF